MSRASSLPARLTYGAQRLRTLRKAFGRLVAAPMFTTWRVVTRAEKTSKVPTHPAGTCGVPFDDAVTMFEADPGLAGLGVKLGPIPATNYVLFGIDYDGAAKGPLPPDWPKTPSYTERSPSGGDRFHILALYEGEPLEAKRVGAVELYGTDRYFTLTGDRLNGAEILVIDPLPFYAALGVPAPQPHGATDRAEVTGAPVAEADLSDRERGFLDAVHGLSDPDESKRDYMVCAELVTRGASDEEVGRVLCAGFWRDKLTRKDYVGRTIARARAGAVTPDKVRAFREASRAIGEGGTEAGHPPPTFTLEEALAELVYVSDGSQVAPREDPRLSWSFSDFENLTAASIFRSGVGRPTSVAKKWLAHPARETVHTRTFKAGAGLFCQSPDDLRALNTWREPPRVAPPADWRKRVKAFLEHVAYLVPDAADRELFLDWLAHVEKRPDVLPHLAFLMFTRTQGIGRNWLSAVLARVWPGVVALDVDLAGLLDGGFNGRLSRKILAVVNEIREGGGGAAISHRRAEQMKRFFTDATRHINPKFGREYVEFNATRWLMFSNHENALPLDRFDRRVYVIENPDVARSEAYYAGLYALAEDAAFVASVREALRARDIGKFNPGMVAPLTKAKRKIIEASMTDAETEMADVADNHPVDCITTDALSIRLFGVDHTARDRAALRFIAARFGARRHPKKVRLNGTQHPVWILRNHDRWLSASTLMVVEEIERKPKRGRAR